MHVCFFSSTFVCNFFGCAAVQLVQGWGVTIIMQLESHSRYYKSVSSLDVSVVW
jgi:hypothetical protein